MAMTSALNGVKTWVRLSILRFHTWDGRHTQVFDRRLAGIVSIRNFSLFIT
jgi:hypothetical protein